MMNALISFENKPSSLKLALSQKVFHFGSNLNKKVQNHYPEHYPPKEKIVIWHPFSGDLSKTENLSEIMPPLG